MINRQAEILESLKDLPEELLKKGLKVRVKVSGNSMFPLLRNGDLVQVDPLGSEPLKRGMVVCIQLQKEYVLHRIFQITGSLHIVTRADFYSMPDQAVPRDQVLGVAVRRWKGGNVEGKGVRVRRYSPLLISWLRPFHRVVFRIFS